MDSKVLNERQQQYLIAIYREDQAAEKYQKSCYLKGEKRLTADEWRWITYGVKETSTSLFRRINKIGRDPGTGSTFQALQRRELIFTRWKRVTIPMFGIGTQTFELLEVRLTRKGRAQAR